MTDKLQCKECGAELAESLKFCGMCGASTQPPSDIKCPACGHENPPEFTFCGECGSSLAPKDEVEVEAPVVSSPTPVKAQTSGDPSLARYRGKKSGENYIPAAPEDKVKVEAPVPSRLVRSDVVRAERITLTEETKVPVQKPPRKHRRWVPLSLQVAFIILFIVAVLSGFVMFGFLLGIPYFVVLVLWFRGYRKRWLTKRDEKQGKPFHPKE